MPPSAGAGVDGGGGKKSLNVPMERHISVLTTSKGISNYMINLQVH